MSGSEALMAYIRLPLKKAEIQADVGVGVYDV